MVRALDKADAMLKSSIISGAVYLLPFCMCIMAVFADRT